MRTLASLILFLAACGGTPKATVSPEPSLVLVDVDDNGVGLEGNDPVGYVASGTDVPGSDAHRASFGGATYWFASAANRQTFEADPARFAPRFGGYCAFAASQNRLSQADPTSFEIFEGQLLMFTNAEFKQLFAADRAGNLAKAEQNWPGLVAKHGKAP